MRSLIVVLSCTVAAACGHNPTAASQATFGGHWVGGYVVRQCTPVGWPSCEIAPERINEMYPLDLLLAQSGPMVSGTLHIVESPVMTVPVTGNVASGSLALSGDVTNPVFNRVSTDTIRITRWATTRGNRDNLQGTFSFQWRTLWGPASGPQRFGEWTLDYDAELVNVIRQQ